MRNFRDVVCARLKINPTELSGFSRRQQVYRMSPYFILIFLFCSSGKVAPDWFHHNVAYFLDFGDFIPSLFYRLLFDFLLTTFDFSNY